MKCRIVLGLVAVTLLFSGEGKTDSISKAYNMGYVDGCSDAGGRPVDNGNRGYACIITGGDDTGTEKYVGGLPGKKIGVGGVTIFESNGIPILGSQFCQSQISPATKNVNMKFSAQGIRELAYASPMISDEIANAISAGKEIKIEGFAFSNDTVVRSEGTIKWPTDGMGFIDFETDCVDLGPTEQDKIGYMKSFGINQGVIIENVYK